MTYSITDFAIHGLGVLRKPFLVLRERDAHTLLLDNVRHSLRSRLLIRETLINWGSIQGIMVGVIMYMLLQGCFCYGDIYAVLYP